MVARSQGRHKVRPYIFRRPAPPVGLDFSGAFEADGDGLAFDDHWNLAPAFGNLQHPFQTGFVFEHVDVFKGDLAAAESLTGSGSVGSEVLPENQHLVRSHGSSFRL